MNFKFSSATFIYVLFICFFFRFLNQCVHMQNTQFLGRSIPFIFILKAKAYWSLVSSQHHFPVVFYVYICHLFRFHTHSSLFFLFIIIFIFYPFDQSCNINSILYYRQLVMFLSETIIWLPFIYVTFLFGDIYISSSFRFVMMMLVFDSFERCFYV